MGDVPDRIAAAMAARAEQMALKAIMGTTTTTQAAPASETLTVEKLLDMMATLPTRETWVVSRIFPPNMVTVAKTSDENFTCINDGTWPRIRFEIQRATPAEHRGNPLYEISPYFIDPDPRDDPEHAEWRAGHAKRILDRIVGAVTAHVELKRVMDAWWRRL